MKTIKSSVVKAKLMALGFETVLTTDSVLFCPSRKWLEQITPHLRTVFASCFLTASGEARDCDKHAVIAKAEVIKANAERLGALEGVAFGIAAVGMLSGSSLNGIPGPGGHVTNFVVTMESDSDEPLFLFYEPQNGNYCPMDGSVGDFSVVPQWALF